MHGMHKQPEPNRLAELRKARGLKLVEVAAAVNKDQSVVHRYERGSVQIPDDVKGTLASFYGVSRAYLMGWDSNPESEAA